MDRNVRTGVDGRRENHARRGRPPKPMPEKIDAPPKQVAKAILAGPPKKDWRYLQGK